MNDDHLRRVRRICAAMPESTEKLSHDEPTFFVRKKVFAMFSNNHHMQPALIQSAPDIYYKPPYVVRGWVGIDLDRIGDEELAAHILDARRLVAPKRLKI